MKYRISIGVNIIPAEDMGSNSLYFNKTFEMTGDTYSSVARQVDALIGAVEETIRTKGETT